MVIGFAYICIIDSYNLIEAVFLSKQFFKLYFYNQI